MVDRLVGRVQVTSQILADSIDPADLSRHLGTAFARAVKVSERRAGWERLRARHRRRV